MLILRIALRDGSNITSAWRYAPSSLQRDVTTFTTALKESRAGVVPEQVGPSYVAPNRLDPLVPGYLHHAERVGAGLGRTGQEASPERVPGELVRI